MTGRRVAVVLASVDRGPAIEASLGGFLREVEGRGEVIVVDATGRDIPAGCRVLRRPAARLVPELWGDGLRSSDAELVAFSTTQMVPRAGWLDAMLAAVDAEGSSLGVGGRIEPGERLGMVDRAVFLLRFLAYGRELPARPSGENALYRRETLLDVEDFWDDGFWEAEVHRGLESLGGTWATAPGAVLDYRGSTSIAEIAAQRVAHARRFGAVRSEGWPASRKLLRSAAAPAVPALMLARAVRGLKQRGIEPPVFSPPHLRGRVRVGGRVDGEVVITPDPTPPPTLTLPLKGGGKPIGQDRKKKNPTLSPWLTCLPTFVMLASLWAWGEALGTFLGLDSTRDQTARSLTDGLTD